MSEFLDIALWIFDLLVKELLPLLSMLMAIIFLYKITKAGQITLGKFGASIKSSLKMKKFGFR